MSTRELRPNKSSASVKISYYGVFVQSNERDITGFCLMTTLMIRRCLLCLPPLVLLTRPGAARTTRTAPLSTMLPSSQSSGCGWRRTTLLFQSGSTMKIEVALGKCMMIDFV